MYGFHSPEILLTLLVIGKRDKKSNPVTERKRITFQRIVLIVILILLMRHINVASGGEKPGLMEIWVRFPKFVLGFVVASIFFSFFVSEANAAAVTNFTKGIRGWWFTLAFLCIGLDTKFKELVAMGGGKPALVFLITQAFNILFTLLIAWLLFSGVFFPAPTL